MAFKMKGHTLPGINQRGYKNMKDGRSTSAPFQQKDSEKVVSSTSPGKGWTRTLGTNVWTPPPPPKRGKIAVYVDEKDGKTSKTKRGRVRKMTEEELKEQ